MKKTVLLAALLCLTMQLPAKEPEQGCRQFLNLNYDFAPHRYYTGDFKCMKMWGLGYDIGYQINNHFYVGAGTLLNYTGGYNTIRNTSLIFAPYSTLRYDCKIENLSPFADIKLGYNIIDDEGAICSAMVGNRFSWNGKFGVNIGVGIKLPSFVCNDYKVSKSDEILIYELSGTKRKLMPALSMQLGIDF